MDPKHEAWLDDALVKHRRLTDVVRPLVEGHLRDARIPFLAASVARVSEAPPRGLPRNRTSCAPRVRPSALPGLQELGALR